MFPRVQLRLFQHWFRYWLGAEQATSHIWTNGGYFTDAYVRHSASMSEVYKCKYSRDDRDHTHTYWTHWIRMTHICVSTKISTLFQITAGRLFRTEPVSEPMLPLCQLDSTEHISVFFYSKFKLPIHKSWHENAVCNMATILSRPQCVDRWVLHLRYVKCNIETDRITLISGSRLNINMLSY